MTFGERLRIAIEQHGFTPKSFAEHLDWSIQRLSLHISQYREPRLYTLQLFIKELPSVDIIWLVTGEKNPIRCTEERPCTPCFTDDGPCIDPASTWQATPE